MSLIQIIPSYRPKDDNVWGKRIVKLLKRLRDFSDNTDIKTIVYAQLWADEDIDNFKSQNFRNVEIKRFNYPLIPEGGYISDVRNVIFKDFYNSDYDFLLMSDDDVLIQNAYGIYDFFTQLDTNPETCKLDVILANPSQSYRYKPLHLSHKELSEKYFTFECKRRGLYGSNYIIRNFKKYNKRPLYAHSTYKDSTHDLLIFDDACIQFDSQIENYKSYFCEDFLVVNNYNFDLTSHKLGEHETFEKVRKMQKVYEKLKLEELGYKTWLSFKNHLKKIVPNYVAIKRPKEYKFTEKDLNYSGKLTNYYFKQNRVYAKI